MGACAAQCCSSDVIQQKKMKKHMMPEVKEQRSLSETPLKSISALNIQLPSAIMDEKTLKLLSNLEFVGEHVTEPVADPNRFSLILQETNIEAMHDVNTADIMQNDVETSVLTALKTASSVGMIMNKYKTVAFADADESLSDSESEIDQDEKESLHSSDSSQSTVESPQKDQIIAMQEEMRALQTQNNETLSIRADSLLPNLYRSGSTEWTPRDVVQEKRAMKDAIEAMMKNEIESHDNV